MKFEVTSGASIMKEETQKALKSMKDGKATDTDELPAEALKALDEHNIEKKPKAMICTEFRTVSIMSHVTKLLLKIIQQRMANKIDKEVSRQ